MFFCSTNVFSDELVKLKCTVDSTFSYNFTNKIIKKTGDAYIEINDYGFQKLIFIDSNIEGINSLSFSTKEDKSKYSFDDKGWEIFGTNKNEGFTQEKHIKIDRNSGKIFLNTIGTTKDNDMMYINTFGSCEKIDTTKKKF
jgi:hypothetical protein